MAVTDYIYDNWGNVTEIDCLFEELPIRFELTTTAGAEEIDEPIGWDEVLVVHKRSKDYHGFNYEFMGEENELQFDTQAGADLIEAEYSVNGNDGECILKKLITYQSTDIVLYEGRLNLGTLKRKDYKYACTVERKSLHQLVNSRIDSHLDFREWKDLDDNEITIKTLPYIHLTTRVLSETFKSIKNVIEETDPMSVTPRLGQGEVFLFYNTLSPDVNTVQGYMGTALGVSSQQSRIYDNFIFEFKTNGTYKIDILLSFKTGVAITPPFLQAGLDIDEYIIDTHLRHWHAGWEPDSGEPMNDYLVADYRLHTDIVGVNNTRSFDTERIDGAISNLELDVEEGDRLTLYTRVFYSLDRTVKPRTVSAYITQLRCEFTMTGASDSPPTTHRCMLVKEVIDTAIEKITGGTDILRTSFYSLAGGDQLVDGCGAARVITPGFELRKLNYGSYNFPLTISLKSLLSSLHAIDCIGMGYEWDSEGQKELIRVEPVDYFYQDVEVMELPEVYDYTEETAKDLIFNTVEVGYEKYNEDDVNSLDEAHAYHEYQLPIRTEANKYNIKSKLNASGYLIETTRRQSLEENENQATTYDDDPFIIHSKYAPEIEFPYPEWAPITDEPFLDVTGTLSPETTYNMAMTPKRMLMAHSKWINSALVYKGGSSVIKNNFTKQNKTLTTTLDEAYACLRGDDQRLTLQEGGDIILSVYGDTTGIYSPEWVNLKVLLSRQQVRYILNAHRGLNEDGKNYGYLTFKDDKGVTRKGWLYEMRFNQMSLEVSMKLLKKKFP